MIGVAMLEMTRRQFVATSALAAPYAAAAAQKRNYRGRRLLSGPWDEPKLQRALKARADWHPFPRASERDAWRALPSETLEFLVGEGADRFALPWPEIRATDFLAYVRTGDRGTADRKRHSRRTKLTSLALAECAEYKGRFLDEILNGIWLICEETYWGSPAHLSMQKAGYGLPDVTEPTVDLFAAETASVLAWCDYLLGEELDRISPLVRKRIRTEVNRRVLEPCEARTDFWWMGFRSRPDGRAPNNWNPWINSNWLAAVLLLETDQVRRARHVYKILRSLDIFLEGYADDGGCDEGPSYWGRAGASLFDCLELLHSASGGAIDVFDDFLIREMGRYIVRAHIYDDWFVNFADASAKVRIDGALVYRYGRAVKDADMQQLGAWAADRYGQGVRTLGGTFERALPALFTLKDLAGAAKRQPLLRDVWLPGIQMMAARAKGGSPRGLYVAAHGGHNAESHNHNDVGDFIVYADGAPAIIDIGVESYTRKTFSPQRYEIWTMRSDWHNLPTIGGVVQKPGIEAAARDVEYSADDEAAVFSLDIAKAYPEEAGIVSWRREIRLDRRRNRLTLSEDYDLRKRPAEITLTLMTHVRPEAAGRGRLQLQRPEFANGPVWIEFDPERFEPQTEEVKITDSRLRNSWGERLYRTLLVAKAPPAKGSWRIEISQTG